MGEVGRRRGAGHWEVRGWVCGASGSDAGAVEGFAGEVAEAQFAARGPQACVVVPTECGGGLLDALRQMDPCDWNGEHDDWRDLMGACKAVGIDREDFVAWSIGDPVYRNEAAHIRHEWGTLWAEHGGAFYKALSQRGIKVQQHNKVQHQHMPKGSHLRPTVSVRKRTDRTCAILAAAVGFMRKRSCGIRLA
jgi:hypothetical protein